MRNEKRKMEINTETKYEDKIKVQLALQYQRVPLLPNLCLIPAYSPFLPPLHAQYNILRQQCIIINRYQLEFPTLLLTSFFAFPLTWMHIICVCTAFFLCLKWYCRVIPCQMNRFKKKKKITAGNLGLASYYAARAVQHLHNLQCPLMPSDVHVSFCIQTMRLVWSVQKSCVLMMAFREHSVVWVEDVFRQIKICKNL